MSEKEIKDIVDRVISYKGSKNNLLEWCRLGMYLIAIIVFIWKAGIFSDKVFNWRTSVDTELYIHDSILRSHQNFLNEQTMKKINNIK